MDAPNVASDMIGEVGTRLAHSAAVAAQAEAIAHLVEEPWASALVDAAWLHDVGYAPTLASTGFHPLDGARWLRARRWPDPVCRLVAWHTRAGKEAELRGLLAQLQAEFEPPPAMAQAALAWADLTSLPTGERCTAEQRISEVLARYPTDSVVHQATTSSRTELLDMARQIDSRLGPQLEGSR